MIEYNATHHIQRSIINILIHQKFARFRDMRPKNVDTNLYSYHLKVVLREGIVEKTDAGYTLTTKGLSYIDRLSIVDVTPRPQPKIMTAIVLRNQYDEVLLYKKLRQPFIDSLTFVSGKLHMDDKTIRAAAIRELQEKTAIYIEDLVHVGDCYMAITHANEVVMNSLVHVFFKDVQKENVDLDGRVQWHSSVIVDNMAPATANILSTINDKDINGFFFEEFTFEL